MMDPRPPTEPYGHWTERNELCPERSPRSFSWATIVLLISLGFTLGIFTAFGVAKAGHQIQIEGRV